MLLFFPLPARAECTENLKKMNKFKLVLSQCFFFVISQILNMFLWFLYTEFVFVLQAKH